MTCFAAFIFYAFYALQLYIVCALNCLQFRAVEYKICTFV